MLAISVDFIWYKDPKGYRLKPRKPLNLRPGQSILDVSQIDEALIIRNGGKLQPYKPLDAFRDFPLFRHFIKAAKSDKGLLEFVRKFGPLTYDGLRGKGDFVPAMIDQAENMAEVLRGSIIGMPLSKLNASIVSKHNEIHLKVSPACLLDALWLQLAQVKSVTKSRDCQQCGEPFMAGRAAGRRSDAKFCSNKCQIRFNSLKRSR